MWLREPPTLLLILLLWYVVLLYSYKQYYLHIHRGQGGKTPTSLRVCDTYHTLVLGWLVQGSLIEPPPTTKTKKLQTVGRIRGFAQFKSPADSRRSI